MDDLIIKINRMLKETTVTSDAETNTAADNKCKEGYIWCSKENKCVPKGTGDGDGPRKYQFHRHTEGRKKRKPVNN